MKWLIIEKMITWNKQLCYVTSKSKARSKWCYVIITKYKISILFSPLCQFYQTKPNVVHVGQFGICWIPNNNNNTTQLCLVPPKSVQIMDSSGRSLEQIYGPLSEDSDLTLLCLSKGGKFKFSPHSLWIELNWIESTWIELNLRLELENAKVAILELGLERKLASNNNYYYYNNYNYCLYLACVSVCWRPTGSL